jgi:hypothetical protein
VASLSCSAGDFLAFCQNPIKINKLKFLLTGRPILPSQNTRQKLREIIQVFVRLGHWRFDLPQNFHRLFGDLICLAGVPGGILGL